MDDPIRVPKGREARYPHFMDVPEGRGDEEAPPPHSKAGETLFLMALLSGWAPLLVAAVLHFWRQT